MKKKGEIIDFKNGNKNIFLLGSSSLCNDAGAEMITPILPFYITALGGGGVAVGLLSGFREGLSSLFKLFGGWYSDKVGKRLPFIFFGYLFSIIFRFLLSIANTWQGVLAFVSLERFGKLRDAPRDAVLAVSTEKRGRGFGIHQTMDVIGGIIGSILVLILFWKFHLGFKSIIMIAAGISAFSLIPLFFVKEPKTSKIKLTLSKGIKNLDKRLKYFVFVASIFTLANFGLYMFILLVIKQATGSQIIPLILYILFNLVWASFTVPFGNLSDKLGRKKVLFLGYSLFFLTALGFVFFSSINSLILLFAVYGLVFAITQSNQKALVSDLAGEMKATAMGFYYAVIGLVNIPAGLIAGLLWDVSAQTMFIYISGVALISIILLGFVKE